MNIVKSVYISVVVASMMLGVPSLAFTSTVDYDDEPKEQEECEEESDYNNLCSGHSGVNGKPFCDTFNATQRVNLFPNATKEGCYDRTTDPVSFCEEFDDLTSTYEDCRQVPESEEYIEYMETGGPDESCLFDVEQIKCLPSPITDECPGILMINR